MTVLASCPELIGVRLVAPGWDALGPLRVTEVRVTGVSWRRREHVSGAATIHRGRAGGSWRLALRGVVAAHLAQPRPRVER